MVDCMALVRRTRCRDFMEKLQAGGRRLERVRDHGQWGKNGQTRRRGDVRMSFQGWFLPEIEGDVGRGVDRRSVDSR